MSKDLVKMFCTAPLAEITNFDLKSLANARQTQIDFEGMQIPIYSWGEGEKVLLVHGWGSRASHMSLLARSIVEAGYQVHTFDAPAHSSVNSKPQKTTSSMFEFGRAISTVANHLGDLHAIVGHSLGAMATLFSITGYMRLEEYKFNSKKIVLISSPSNIKDVLSSFSKTNKFTEGENEALQLGLEKDFEFSAEDYNAGSALKNRNLDLLIIHDEDDDEVSISNAYDIKKAMPQTRLHITIGLGHKKILFSRDVIKVVSQFINRDL
jgi:pimeloyl-ACP methyl ester carboxylesterase